MMFSLEGAFQAEIIYNPLKVRLLLYLKMFKFKIISDCV